MDDTLHRFLFEQAPIRGEIVHLDATLRAVLERHEYPAPVRRLLGELMAAGALLAATLKFDGAVILQIQGDGPVRLAVAECTSTNTLRATAKWVGEPPCGDLRALAGNGRFAITLASENGGQHYQGVVDLDPGGVAAALERYLRDSEQLESRLWLASAGSRVAGMLLQKLPAATDHDAEDWSRITQLAATLTPGELMTLAPHVVVRRLFHEEDVRLFGAQALAFRCSCSPDRVAAMLRMLGRGEVDSILVERGAVDVHCEFCNRGYRFDRAEAERVFAR